MEDERHRVGKCKPFVCVVSWVGCFSFVVMLCFFASVFLP